MTLLADAPTTARPVTARPVTASQVADAELDGAWVVDIRHETSSPVPAAPAPAPYVGWLVPWEDDIVLLAGSPDVMAPRSDSRWR